MQAASLLASLGLLMNLPWSLLLGAGPQRQVESVNINPRLIKTFAKRGGQLPSRRDEVAGQLMRVLLCCLHLSSFGVQASAKDDVKLEKH